MDGLHESIDRLRSFDDGSHVSILNSGAVPTERLFARLELGDATPIAVGHLREVFEHPLVPQCLIKVMRADAVRARWNASARWYKRLPRARHYTGYVRELKEFIVSHARVPDRDAPIARMFGVVETDRGLGLVSEKVVAADGSLAPTLATVYAREGGFSAGIERGLGDFVDALLACHVIVGDLHAWNIVYGTDSRGGPRFVLIDGFGEKHAIPLASMSRILNARNTRRLYRRMRAQLVELVAIDTPAAALGVREGGVGS